jgi:hypothetical protein
LQLRHADALGLVIVGRLIQMPASWRSRRRVQVVRPGNQYRIGGRRGRHVGWRQGLSRSHHATVLIACDFLGEHRRVSSPFLRPGSRRVLLR